MPAQCEHYRVKTGSCGLLDKDDHTYSCDSLCMKNECPLSMELKDVIISRTPKDILDSIPNELTDFVCHTIEIAFSHFGKIPNDKAAIISRVRKVADEMIAEAKQSDSIPSSWIVGWGYNLKEAIGGIEP